MITRLAATAAIVFFLATAFRSGWRRAETDFPNYYTAAVLIRKGLPVREYYDWTWFQRQMNYAGIERQLGGYQPQTPLTALPLVGLASFAPQTAKRIWLAMNLGFLAANRVAAGAGDGISHGADGAAGVSGIWVAVRQFLVRAVLRVSAVLADAGVLLPGSKGRRRRVGFFPGWRSR